MTKQEYSGTTRTMTWLLMPWLLISPSHQQPRDWQFKMGPCLLQGRTLRTCIISVPTIVEVSHYNDVPMSAMGSQITSLTIVHTIIYSGLNQRKQSTAPLAFVRGFTGDRWIPRTKGQSRGNPYPEPVYTGWSSVHWNATGVPLVDPVYTGIPLGHPANTCRVHWNTTGKT